MLNRTNILAALIFGVGAVAFANSGCELISSVDRTKIPGGSGGSATGGGSNPTGGGSNPTGGGTNPGGGGTTANGGGGNGGTSANGGGGNGGSSANGGGGTGGSANGGGGSGGGVPAHCSDGTTDDGETDKDCGGPDCRAAGLTCALYHGCAVTADCAAGAVCLPSGGVSLCFPASCNNGTQDNGETDVDCGGGGCPYCAVTKKCLDNNDCVTLKCDTAATHLCIP